MSKHLEKVREALESMKPFVPERFDKVSETLSALSAHEQEVAELVEKLSLGVEIVNRITAANAILEAADVDDQPQYEPEAFEELLNAFKDLDAWMVSSSAALRPFTGDEK